MAISEAYARVSDIRQLVTSLALDTPAPAAPTAVAPAAQTSFQAQLQSSLAAPAPAPAQQADGCSCCGCCCCGEDAAMEAALPTAAPLGAAPLAVAAGPDPTGAVGTRALAAAETQLGQAEQPPGSNDGPALSVYRTAVEGAAPGEPWCAYFVSWAARQAGSPLGDAGQGLGSVAEITDWAQRTGRLLPAGAQPQPGDLILFGDRHVGIVESVNADGSLTTVEGNYRNQVSRVQRSPAEATGFVRL